MANDTLGQEVLAGLAAYAQQYDLPPSPVQLDAVIGSLLNVKTQADNQLLSARQIDHIVQWVKAGLDIQSLKEAIVDESKQLLAAQAHRWRQELEHQVTGVLNAYLQEYSPDLDVGHLQDIVTAIAPMVKSGQATRQEVVGVAQTLFETFASASPLATVVGPTFVDLARDLATVLSQKDTEAAVSETVTAYAETFSPAAETIGESLIENALGAILKNQVMFGIDTDLNLAEKRLIIQQVSFKLNIMEQSPPPSKSAELMAQQLHAEIERFKAERRSSAGDLDVTEGRLSNDGLSISSNWAFTDRPSNGDATED